MITLRSCPICESDRITKYLDVNGIRLVVEIMPDVKLDGAVVTHYYLCQDCHLIFQNPRLSDNELDKFYTDGYYRRIITPPPEGMDADEANRAKVDTEIIKRQIGKVTSHLDVGCGRGCLLEAVGAKVQVGIETDASYVRVKGVEVYPKVKEVPQILFDLVTAIHVLEHVPYPLDFLKEMKKFVDKNGYLVIEVPSSKTRGGPLGFVHLSYFEPDVLRLMCKRLGLEVVYTEFTPHLVLICKLER